MTKMESEQESDRLLKPGASSVTDAIKMNDLDGNGHSVDIKEQNQVKFEKKAAPKKKGVTKKKIDAKRKERLAAEIPATSGDCNNETEERSCDTDSNESNDNDMPVFKHRNSTSLVKATIDIPGDSLKKIKRRHRHPPGLGLKIVVAILFLVIFVGVLVTWAFYKEEKLAILRGQKFRFMEDSRMLYLAFDSDDPMLVGDLGMNLPMWQLPKSCSDEWGEINKLCYWWKYGASLKIFYYKLNNMHCYNVTWESLGTTVEPKDCYTIGSLDWYGIAANMRGAHHVLSQNFSYVPLVPGGGRVLGSVMERYWLASNGIAFITSRDDPILLSWDEDEAGKFCLWSSYKQPFYAQKNEGKHSHLHYTMCKADHMHMHSTHLQMRQFFHTAPSLTKSKMAGWLRSPLWAIGSRYGNDTNNSTVLHTTALELLSYLDNNTTAQPCGIVELDFGWEKHLGDLEFNPDRLDDVLLMLQNLSASGCQISLPVSLFSHFLSRNFDHLLRNNFFVKDAGGEAAGLTKWKSDQLAFLDISNSEAVLWFLQKLETLSSEYGIRMFRFLHGESGILPYKARFTEDFNAVSFTTEYNKLAVNFTNTTLVHAAMGSQHLPIAISVIGKNVLVDGRRCLQDIIPALLTSGILGYPYVSLDGGDLWGEDVDVSLDLYMRWTQMSTFLPVMKVYTPPNGFSTKISLLLKKWTEFHSKTIIPLMEALSAEVTRGAPLIRPIWWVDPQDKVAQGIGDEFLVGNDILVAPILCERTLKRDIYLPTGKWKDPLKKLDFDGGRWIYDYSIDLDDIPFFYARQ